MSDDKSLTYRTTDLFLDDVRQSQKAREALCAFRELVYQTPFNPGLDEFVETLSLIFGGFRSKDKVLSQLEALIGVFSGLQLLARQDVVSVHRNPYHNAAHSLQVTANRIMLGRVEQLMREGTWTPENYYKFIRGTVISFNHDTGHDGTGNSLPVQQETIAYQLLHPILRSYGVQPKQRKFIEEVTFLTDPMLPGEILKYGAAYHGFSDNILHLPHDVLEQKIVEAPATTQGTLFSLLLAVERNRELVNEALLTKAADMACSFGLRPEFCATDDRNVQIEMKAANSAHRIADDETSILTRRLFVMLSFVGAKRDPDGQISATFMHPVADRLFGEILQGLESEARAKLPAENIARIEAGLREHVTTPPVAHRRRWSRQTSPKV